LCLSVGVGEDVVAVCVFESVFALRFVSFCEACSLL
jgi:hypothetical protein